MKLLITWWDWRKEGSNVGVEMQDQPESGIDLPHSEMMSREMAGRSGRKRDSWLMALLTPEGAGCTCRSRLRKVLIQVCCHDTPCLSEQVNSSLAKWVNPPLTLLGFL